MDNQEDRVVLTGEEAIEKFLEGKEQWNTYVEQYPETDVNFPGVDFSNCRKKVTNCTTSLNTFSSER
jgi:hypothetical protein